MSVTARDRRSSRERYARAWRARRLSPEFLSLIPNPTLLVSGQVASRLTDGHLVDVDFPRHTVFPDDECVNAAVITALVEDMPLEATLCE